MSDEIEQLHAALDEIGDEIMRAERYLLELEDEEQNLLAQLYRLQELDEAA